MGRDDQMTQLVLDWTGAPNRLDMVNDREQIRAMEIRTYDCGSKRAFHAPHSFNRAGLVECPGLVTLHCGLSPSHIHHRWAEPDRFLWCNGIYLGTA